MTLEEYLVRQIKSVFAKKLKAISRSDLDFLSIFIDLSFPYDLGPLIETALSQNSDCWLVAVGHGGYENAFICISNNYGDPDLESKVNLFESNVSKFFEGGELKFCFHQNRQFPSALISGYEIKQIFHGVQTLDRIN